MQRIKTKPLRDQLKNRHLTDHQALMLIGALEESYQEHDRKDELIKNLERRNDDNGDIIRALDESFEHET